MKNFIVKTLNGMSHGLFATLIVGVIIQQFGNLLGVEFLSVQVYNLLAGLMGVGIALGIGLVLKKDGLQLVMLAIVGAISTKFILTPEFTINQINGPGNPLTAYFVTICSILLIDLIYTKKTPVDILIIPLGIIIISLVLTLALSLPLEFVTKMITQALTWATTTAEYLMVIIIAVSMGMILTAPISSAAIAFAIQIGTIHGGAVAGAAVVGTSIQMIGFAIQSRRDNGVGEVLSIAVGTSMLQFKNIVKNPAIWIPTILASAIVAPITHALGFISTSAGAGMGTSGLVGPMQSLGQMNYSLLSFTSIAIIMVLGGLLVYVFDKILYIKGFIKDGDLSLKENLSS